MPSLKQVWENRVLILHGLINRIFSTPEIKQLAKQRLAICKPCKFNSVNTENPELPYKHCTKCGCALGIKPYSPNSTCPIGKW